MALASFSEGREVDKVKSAALLSPIAYLSHMTTALGDVAARAFVGEVSIYIYIYIINIYTLQHNPFIYIFMCVFTDHQNIWSC